jgi:hypothetical protein
VEDEKEEGGMEGRRSKEGRGESRGEVEAHKKRIK